MKIINKLNNYLYDTEYKLIITNKYINIINYNEIIDFNNYKISVLCNNTKIIIEGLNLAINKMINNELLIYGEVSSISIKR